MLLMAVLLATRPGLAAETGGEKRDFEAAAGAFTNGFYARAEAEFDKFAQTYTNSALLPQALLFQAEARLEQTNYAGAIELLTARQPQAGAIADQYAFWLAEAYLRKSEYQPAADTFAKLIKEFPASSRLLEASIGQATALAKLGQWPRVVELLQQTNGVFQSAARTNAADKWVPQGYLLLGEALLAQKDYRTAEATLLPLGKRLLEPRLAWEWQFLICRVQLADGRPEAALTNTANLLSLANSAAQPALRAQSIAFKASLLERLGRPDQAIATYKENLAPGLPAQSQRQALLKITELSLAQNKLADAIQTLESFLAQFSKADAADRAWLTLGELRLRQEASLLGTNQTTVVRTNVPGATNYLQLALDAFQALAQYFPQSPLFGQGQLGLGWCFWLRDQFPESQKAFQSAVERLPLSADLAMAHFKLGDAEFRQREYRGAITNYNAVVGNEKFAALPEVETNLFEPALYQTVQAGLSSGDLAAATNALQKILAWYPNGFHTERAVLLAGQALSRQGDPARARRIFSDFIRLAPQAPLRPEVELAIARTYEQEAQWTQALQQYETWLASYTNSEARPRAEYYRARASFYAGDETNALTYFTNFVARFPTNDLAPLAQWWVADHYYQTGDYKRAENDFQLLSHNWPGTDLDYQAQMMAGRAAVGRQSWEDAKVYFTKLTGDKTCPLDLHLHAMLALGDYWMSRVSTNKLADYGEALGVFNTIGNDYPTNPLAVLALGAKANCLLQSSQYDAASNTYQQVISSPLADVSARSQAEVGLAITLEKQAQAQTGAGQTALLKLALDHYLNVFYGTLLRGREQPDLFWVKKAGLEAARLAGDLGQWQPAVNIYGRLQELLPQLRASFAEKQAKARKNLLPIPE